MQRVICAFVISTLCFAQDTARMDQVVQSYVANKQFMGSVLVARENEVLFNKSYGSANLEWNLPNTPTTKFRLGSITKQFTAASILLLEERGKLRVEDPVKKYMPDAPPAWDKITIYNVLTHTAGIPNFTSFPEYSQMEPFDTSVEKIVAKFRDRPLDFEPGEKMSYSNSGYVLLGYLIEKVSGGSYEKFLQENIFAPLSMNDSGYDSNSAVIARRASGYTPGPNGPINARFVHMSIPHGAGALYSTTEDLLRWEQGLFGGKLLSPTSLQKMTSPFKNDYGFGLIIRNSDGRKQIWHNGAIEGFNTSMAYYPDSKLTIILLANLNGLGVDEMLPKLASIAHGQAVQLTSERKEIVVPRQTLARYVGTYELTPEVKMTITIEGEQLITQVSGQRKFPAFAEADSSFFLKVGDVQITFGKDVSGVVTDLVLHQFGSDQKAHRVSDKVVERKEIALSPELLGKYAGTYELRPGMDAVITLEGGQLMWQRTGQPKFPLFAESEAVFFLKAVDIQIEFMKDEKGMVTALILHQGLINLKGQRR